MSGITVSTSRRFPASVRLRESSTFSCDIAPRSISFGGARRFWRAQWNSERGAGFKT
jgi:hypothetical protein